MTSASRAPARRFGPRPRASPDGGVFSTKDLAEGEGAISIPYHAALTQDNGALYFPTLSKELIALRRSGTKRSLLRRIWNRIMRRRRVDEEQPIIDDDHWQAELSAYALEALAVDHPWATWISQWRRDDPMHSLVEQSAWAEDGGESIIEAVSDFRRMAPFVPEHKVGAAVGIRLEKLDSYLDGYRGGGSRVRTSPSLYSVALSRAVGISEGHTAILPMHDMINHSDDPNVGMAFGEDGTFNIIALRDVPKGAELFLRYMDVIGEDGAWDEDKATWLLVQWGIPSAPPERRSAEPVDGDDR